VAATSKELNDFSDGFFGGVITAMVTPMHCLAPENSAPENSAPERSAPQNSAPRSDAIAVDFETAAKLAVHLAESGSDALVLSGTTGEAPTTHIDEKAQLIKTVCSALLHTFPGRKVPIIAGTGSNDTAHAVRNTEVAFESGADAALVVTPYYSRPSQAGIFEHYRAVAASTSLPVILYDVPARSGVSIEIDTYTKLAEIPNIVAVKDATGNVYRALKIQLAMNAVRKERGLPEVTLYSGDDTLLLPFLAVGARGIISVASHLVGDLFSEVVEKQLAGDTKSALKAFQKSMYAVDICNDSGQQAACTKAALQALGVIPNRQMRLPNLQLDDGTSAKLASRMLLPEANILASTNEKKRNEAI
jgi:4-hydroxy-tetrahydrodipicolinate synthase